jgi:hypothetical protein
MKSTIKIRQTKIENLLPWVWNGVQCDDSYSIAGRADLASVEYGYNSSLWAIDADANENVSGKNITAHGNKIANPRENHVPLFKIAHRTIARCEVGKSV